MTSPDDMVDVEALIREIGMGDRRSFEEFYNRFSGLIYATALRVLTNEGDAQDVMQDVMFMIWEKAPMYDPSRGKPLTWALTMTRNKAIDRIRSRERRNRLHDEVELEIPQEGAQTHQEPFEDLDHAEKNQRIRNAVMKLSKDQREAIEMAYFKELTQQEIAARLQEPLGTVKARIRRGMLKLRKMIGTTF